MMKRAYTTPDKEQDRPEPTPISGKDEMNLAEFPFASLRTRGDSRKSIIYEGWVTDKDGHRHQQKWIVRGLADLGLPTEFDERVLVALISITAMQGFNSRKVPFSVYQIIKTMDLVRSAKEYRNIEDSLDRLVGVTIKSERAFWENGQKERVTTAEAFHLIDRYWLRYREDNERIREEEGIPGFIVWGEVIWNSFKANYIKNLDLAFFYSLQIPTTRRLYRFLDKRMQYQDEYEIDIIELANRLGMARYRKPADIKLKLRAAFDELIVRDFLKSAEPFKYKKYTRVRFVKASKAASQPAERHDDVQEETEAYEDRYTAQLNAVRKRYGITDELVDIWDEALVEIKGATTASTFHLWFMNTHLLSIENGVALIGTPHKLAVDWLSGRMTPVIKRALEGAAGHPVEQLAFQVLEARNVLE